MEMEIKAVQHLVELVRYFCQPEPRARGFNFELIQDGENHLLHYGVSGVKRSTYLPVLVGVGALGSTTPERNSLSYRGYIDSGVAYRVIEEIKPFLHLPLGVMVNNARIVQRSEDRSAILTSSEKHESRSYRQGSAESPVSVWLDREALLPEELKYLEEMSGGKTFTVYKTCEGDFLHLKWGVNNHLTLPKEGIAFRREKLRGAL